ncbi:hypothetical protein LTR53_018396, partial [Teratosphaeriaceae sp. CCFEE 6253]
MKEEKKKTKIKLSLGKKKAVAKEGETLEEEVVERPTKGKKKKEKKEKDAKTESPEVVRKPDKGKKPKAADKSPSAGSREPASAERKEKGPAPTPPPAPPINLEGTGLEGLAPTELPQKRKGPGRPPKNGLVSKRDMSFINRKRKEYEKRGLVAPPFDVILNIVREENKIRDAQAKAQAAGQPVPEMGTAVVQSIEGGDTAGLAAVNGDANTYGGPTRDSHMMNGSASAGDAARKASPKPKRP